LDGTIAAYLPAADFLKNPLACVSDLINECPDRSGRCARRSKVKTFTIENETNNITLHGSAKEAESVSNSERFNSEASLWKIAENWPAARPMEIWNSLPGVTPVKKFKDRASAISRIWKALQSLGEAGPAKASERELTPVFQTPFDEPTEPEATPLLAEPVTAESSATDVPAPVTPQKPHIATEETPAKNKATRAKKTPDAATTNEADAPRAGSKTSQVIAMLKREGGVTLEEIMIAMGWQKHTTRAMLSAGGSLTKNHGLVVVSEKVGDKRVYSIKG
jgi:hypothetical protein